MNRILMFGQFMPPVTGEAVVNEKVVRLLKDNQYNVQTINSSIIDNANSVGKFSLKKIIKSIGLYFSFFKKVTPNTIIYLTPGQTKLGIYRLLPILWISNVLNLRLIAHWHGYGMLWLIKNRPNLMKKVINAVDCHILLTQDLEHKINQTGLKINNAKVITNYIEQSNYIHATKSSREPLSVLYLGSLMEEKGILTYLTAAKNMPSIQFHICGAGSEEILSKIKSIANSSTNIIYHGLVSGEDKLSILRKSDVFVLQTHYPTEGVPLSILEAMSFGCAIITTKHNGIPETVEDAAIYIEKSNATSLEKTLIELENDRQKLDSYQLKAVHRTKKFSVNNFEKSILDVFKEVNETRT